MPLRFVSENALEGLVAELLGGHEPGAASRVVDEQVERPELRDGLRDGGLDLAPPGHVHLQRQRPAADRADLAREAAIVRRHAQTERDVGPRLRERQRDRPAQPPRRARDQGDPPVEVETHRAHPPGESTRTARAG